MKILICEDHAIFRQGLQLTLADLGADVVEAATSDEALALIQADEKIDLVLLDLQMPGTDGWTALRKLRSDYASIPVVIVSASEEPAQIRRALSDGASGFIPKSSSAELLKGALQVVLSGGVYVPPQALPDAPQETEDRTPRSEGRRERASGLTPRQVEVLSLMARGLTNKEIGGVLKIAEGTVRAHLNSIFETLDVSNRTEAALVMRDLGLDD